MSTIGTQVVSTVAATPIMWWIIPAVIGPILLIIVIILLVCWRWKKGAPKAKVVPDTIQMLETNRTRVRIVERRMGDRKVSSFVKEFIKNGLRSV